MYWKKAFSVIWGFWILTRHVGQGLLCDRSFMASTAHGVLTSFNFPLNYTLTIKNCRYRFYSSRANKGCTSTSNTKSRPYQRGNIEYQTKGNPESPAQFFSNGRDGYNASDSDKNGTNIEKKSYRWSPIGNDKALEIVDELICFKFHRFRLHNSPKNCTDADVFLQFPGGVKYCNKGILSSDNSTGIFVRGNYPESVFTDHFCWPILPDEDYMEIYFNAETNRQDTFTDTGFYATFNVTKGYITLQQTVINPVLAPAQVLKAPCPDGYFGCFDGVCILERLMCNGGKDCQDGSDETYIHARCPGKQDYTGCDFELTHGIINEMCGFRSFNWRRSRFSEYGPRYDHTIGKAYGPGNFTYTQFNFKRVSLYSEDPGYNTMRATDHCFRFWYFMSGTGIGELNVIIHTPAPHVSQNTSAWSRVGEHGSHWHMGELDLPSYITKIERIVFDGLRGSFIQANIGIDDISLTEGNCYGDDISCTFELGWCSWVADTDRPEYGPWVRRQGIDSGIHQTGPLRDSVNNSNGYFLYFDSTNLTLTTKKVRAISKPVSEFDIHRPRWCIQFSYTILKGNGLFKVLMKHPNGEENLIFYSKEEEGWVKEQHNIVACRPIQIVLQAEAFTGGGIEVAVDNIVISQSMCYGDSDRYTTTRKPTTPSNICDKMFCCKVGGKVISRDKVCDGRFDCDDKSDEEKCNNGGLSVLGIVAIVGGILLVMILVIFHLLWTVKRRMARRRRDARIPYPESEEIPHENSEVYPIDYGEPPPPYTEAYGDSPSRMTHNPNRGHSGSLTISLRWEPPPAYDISIVGIPRGSEVPAYSPRCEPPPFGTEPPPFELAILGSGLYIPQEHEEIQHISRATTQTSLNTIQSLDSTTDSNAIEPNIAIRDSQTCVRDNERENPNTEFIGTPLSYFPQQTALAGIPAVGHEIERYFTLNPSALRTEESDQESREEHHPLTRSFRRLTSIRTSDV